MTVSASHTERSTGAARSGTLQNEGQTVNFNLILGPVAAVKARVLLADGVTPARGGGIRLETGNSQVRTGITDSNGEYLFASIPTPCTFSLYVEDAAGVGQGRASGTLSANGQLLDLGNIILDDKAIFVTGINPAAGSVNVPVDQQIRVLFSEPADPATLNSANLYLMQGGSKVAGTLQVDNDNSGVTFTPAAPLNGFSLYTFVVTGNVRDRVWRPLASAQSISFTTIDNIPPIVMARSPQSGGNEVAVDAVIRITFSEPLNPATLGSVELLSGATVVATRIDLLQWGTVIALTPLAPLAANGLYTVAIAGVQDLVGNVMVTPQSSAFATIDTRVPTLTALTVPTGSDLIKGNTLSITAQTPDTDVALVDFFVDDVRVKSISSAPFTMAYTLPREGIIHLKAIAQDKVGNRGLPVFLDLTVVADTPPTVAITAPLAGSSVNTGATVNIEVLASDDLAAREITLTVSGELTATRTVTSGNGKSYAATFALSIPSTITQGGSLLLTAIAKDSAGVLSAPVQRTLVVRDSIAPALVAASSPGQAVLYRPGESGVASFSFSDNVGISAVNCLVSGAAAGSQNFSFEPPQTQVSGDVVFQVAADAISGASVAITCSAVDTGNNQTNKSLALSVADIVPPTVVITAPAAGSSVNTGASFTVTVVGSDDAGVKEIVLTGSGAFNFTQTRTNLGGKSATESFTVTLPVDADPTLPLTLTANVKDSAGQSGAPAFLNVSVRDSIPPQGLTLSSDGQTTLYRPGESGTLRLSASDNIGLVAAACTASRAGSGGQQWSYNPASKTISELFTFSVASTAVKSDSIELSCIVHDAAGLAEQKSLILGVADISPPQVVTTSPVEGATGVPVRSTLSVTFDETLAPASLTGETVRLFDAENLPLPGTTTLASGGQGIVFTPEAPLQRGSTYSLFIDGLTDLVGNRIASASFSFTTDAGAPQLIATIPLDGDGGIQVGATLVLRFDEAVDLASVTPRLSVASPYGPVNGTISLALDGTTVYFKPFGLLAYNRAYSVVLAAGVEDISGNSLPDPLTFAFTTERPNPDLLGLWHFDGDLGDASGNDRNALPSGTPAEIDDGIIAQALACDGLDDSIALGTWFDRQTFSVELWVNPAATQNQNATLLGNNYSAASSWTLQQEGSKVNTYQWLQADGSAPLAVTIPAGEWSQLVLTRDGATRTNSLYHNGQLVGSNQGSGEIVYNGSQSLRAGRASSGGFWNGALDEVAILGVALSAADVREHFIAATSGDRIPPAAPTAVPLPVSTSAATILLTGSKDAASSIRVNGQEIVAVDAASAWQAFYPLVPGENLLTISSRDASGNSSEAIELYTRLLPANAGDPSLFALWPLDGNGLDYAGNNHHLTAVKGNPFSSDRASGMAAATFSGVGYMIDATAGSQLTATSNFTVSGWIKPLALQSGGVIDLGSESASSWELWYDASARLTYQQNWNRSAGVETFSTANGSVPLGRWTHFAVVYGDKAATLYLGGVASASKAFSNNPVMDANGWLELGVNRPGSDDYFKGLLDDVAIHTRALSSAEVATLAAAPPLVTLSSDGLVTHYAPGAAGQAVYGVSDPDGVAQVVCTAAGAASARQVQDFAGGVQGEGVLDFVVDGAAKPNALIRIDCSALDVTGQVGSAWLQLQVADLQPPLFTTTSISDNTLDLIGNEPFTIGFDEVLDPASVNATTVRLFDGAGNPVAGRITLSVDGKAIIFTPLGVLPSGGSYRMVVGTGVTDLAGNPLGSAVEINFTTKAASDLVITAQGSASAPHTLAGGRYAQVSISSSSYVVATGAVIADTLIVTGGSTLTHPAIGTSGSSRLEVTAGTITIDATSKIDVSGKGYLGANQPGNSSNVGRTYGNTTSGGSSTFNGGGYGGSGGMYSGYVSNATYGSLYDPNELGSGGGANGSSSTGGNGGGLIRVVAGSLTLDGSIVANGGASTYGGGSGGGIRLDVGSLSGNGTISAKGGTSTSGYGAGGGGRIAIYYDSLGLATSKINAAGGSSTSASYNGGVGTLYLQDRAQAFGTVLIDNAGIATDRPTPLPATITGSLTARGIANLTASTGAIVVENDFNPADSNVTVSSGSLLVKRNLTMVNSTLTLSGDLNVTGTLALTSQSTLSHLVSTATAGWKLKVTAGTITIDATSKIDVSGKGYLGANQPGNSSNVGRTYGNTTSGGSSTFNGGGYGGSGGMYSGYVSNATYGSLYDPNELGSGGGANGSSSTGGNGGGLIRVVAGSLTLDGSIVANGGASTYGGGSGGGIRIDVGSLSGNGTISAKGGTSNSGYGAGGGGRIAIYYDSQGLATSKISAAGGSSTSTNASYSGGAGTVYLQDRAQTEGSVIADNAGVATNRSTPLPCDVAGSAVVQNGAVVMWTGVCP